MPIESHIQGFDLGAEVTLFQIDLSDWGQGILYLHAGREGNNATLTFDGNEYAPFPITAEGFEITGDGPIPQPNLAVSNIDGVFGGYVETYDDLEGAIVTRLRTYERFLDDGVEPDPSAVKLPDVYQIIQKTRHDHEQIQWKLAALIDLEGMLLPARKVVRDYCDLIYRVWNGSSFDYSEATCPYVGANSYDESDVATTSANDKCGKRLGSCRTRFGTTAALPFGGFPGVSKIRAR